MKKILFLSFLLLSGCFSETTDINVFIENVKRNTPNTIKPMAEVPEFKHIEYVAKSESSPFVLPSPKQFQQRIQESKDCVNPNEGRIKETLEKYSLDTLRMRGTLEGLGVSWALVETSDNNVHRVKVGNYLGAYHGKITHVNEQSITILELIPDATGCWVERESTVGIADASSTGERN